MRDILIIAIVLIGATMALRRPWVGVLLWTWVSIMNPHRYAWGWAYDAPLAAVAAGSTLLGLLMTRERDSPFKGAPATWLVLLMAWMTLSWLFGVDRSGDYEQWSKVMKIDLMIFVALMLINSKRDIVALTWVATFSLAILGIKGGVFTIAHGGVYRVWGPPGSFVGGNNEFALALVMTIPLMRFLQLQLSGRWARHAMTAAMVLCAAAALGSQSRGALLAIAGMSVPLWWRGKSRFAGGVLMLLVGAALVSFMPGTWSNRMDTIANYQDDASAMGRINAWWNAWNLAFHYPMGVGFDAARPELFERFAPVPDLVLAAHSIYFQMLGHHGFIGLGIFLMLWISTWRNATWLRRHSASIPEAKWCSELGAMAQVSLVGYAVGGAFLSLAYFDLPYNVMVLVLASRVWVQKRAWKTEGLYTPRWRLIPGLGPMKTS